MTTREPAKRPMWPIEAEDKQTGFNLIKTNERGINELLVPGEVCELPVIQFGKRLDCSFVTD